MKAELLGATFLTLLVRCSCGKRNFLDRAEWQRSGALLCTNCGAWIRYNDLQVLKRSRLMGDLDIAQAALVRAAEQLRARGLLERSHTTLNMAQGAACMKGILAQDWRIERDRARKTD